MAVQTEVRDRVHTKTYRGIERKLKIIETKKKQTLQGLIVGMWSRKTQLFREQWLVLPSRQPGHRVESLRTRLPVLLHYIQNPLGNFCCKRGADGGVLAFQLTDSRNHSQHW